MTSTSIENTQNNIKTFGEKFSTIVYDYNLVNNKITKKLTPILSEQAIDSFNYLEKYIKRGLLPTKDDNNELLGLYSYIADREEFDGGNGPFFNGFISLKKYHHLYEYEVYYNKEDNIKIYVYLNQFDMNKYHQKYRVKPNKAHSFFGEENPKKPHVDPYHNLYIINIYE
jgi:hypothetical protein